VSAHAADIQRWKDYKTNRAVQITEVMRRVYRLDTKVLGNFSQNSSEITKYRDMAVHPSLELKRACSRPDIPVLVDWKFSTYRHSNAEQCFGSTMKMLVYLYERKSGNSDVDQQMEDIIVALQQLHVVRRQTTC
jgi:hypothetical protein